MSNENKISLYLRGNNLKELLKESKKQDRSANNIINIALENYFIKGSLKEWLRANPKATASQIIQFIETE